MKNFKRVGELEKEELTKVLMLFLNGELKRLFYESDYFKKFDPEECIDWWLLVDKDDPYFGIDTMLNEYDRKYEKSW